MSDEEPKPKVMWRAMPVCAGCWTERHPDRVAVKVLGVEPEECVVCEERVATGIYVRVRVEWR